MFSVRATRRVVRAVACRHITATTLSPVSFGSRALTRNLRAETDMARMRAPPTPTSEFVFLHDRLSMTSKWHRIGTIVAICNVSPHALEVQFSDGVDTIHVTTGTADADRLEQAVGIRDYGVSLV